MITISDEFVIRDGLTSLQILVVSERQLVLFLVARAGLSAQVLGGV